MKVDTVSSSYVGPSVGPAASLPGITEASGNASHPTPVPEAQAPASSPPPTVNAAKAVANQINDFLKSSSAGVEIAFDAPANRFIVRVVNSATNEVIRQMPSEEVLAIAHSLDQAAGLLLKQDA